MSAAPPVAAADGEDEHFIHRPDPDMPGWMTWELRDPTRFNATLGPLRVRREGAKSGRLRMIPARVHGNLSDNLHGGALMALIDIALFATCRVNGIFHVGRASTLDCNVQFLAPGRLDAPADALTEVLRETGRLVFLRGLVVQGEDDAYVCCAYSGTIRKPSAPR